MELLLTSLKMIYVNLIKIEIWKYYLTELS